MSRTLASAAAIQAARRNGAFPLGILEIRWGGETGTKYYSTEPLTSPVVAEGRVLGWQTLQLEAKPEATGGYGQISLDLADHDLALKSLMDVIPGPRDKLVYLHVWFVGTDWSDRLTLFGGVIAGPTKWREKDASWQLTLKGFEQHFNRDLGFIINRIDFPEVQCDACTGSIIPIVYGDPCRRVPCCVIDRPGSDSLVATLQITDNFLYITREAADANFPVDTEISLIVGQSGAWERVTGGFYNSANRQEFAISSRGGIDGRGVCPGLYGSGGIQSALIEQADISSPGTSRGGYPIFWFVGGRWIGAVITQWLLTGSDIAVHPVGGIGIVTGTPWLLCAQPSVPHYPPGTPVYQEGTWTYAVNSLPSVGIDRVEARSQVQGGNGGGSRYEFFQFNTAYYTVNLDNRDYNTILGRTSGDPGITTVTLDNAPTVFGFSDEQVYSTVRGITENTDTTEPPLSNPADIIRHLLTCPWLGNLLAADYLDAATFAATQPNLDTPMQFAIIEQKKLFDICGSLAFQAGCLFFVDGGRACLIEITTDLPSDPVVLTVTQDDVSLGTLQIQDGPDAGKTTQVSGRFKQTVVSEEFRINRKSPDAIGYYGVQKKDLDLWAFQNASAVAASSERWLRVLLGLQQRVVLTTYLQALAVRPGDVVIVDFAAGDSIVVLDAVRGRVAATRCQPPVAPENRMGTIELTLDLSPWTFEVEIGTEDDTECDPPRDEPDPANNGDGDLPVPPDPLPSTTTGTSTTTGSTTTAGTSTTPGSTTTPSSGCADECSDCFQFTVAGMTGLTGSQGNGTWIARRASPCNIWSAPHPSIVGVGWTLIRTGATWALNLYDQIGTGGPAAVYFGAGGCDEAATLYYYSHDPDALGNPPATIDMAPVSCPPPTTTGSSTTTGSTTTGGGTTTGGSSSTGDGSSTTAGSTTTENSSTTGDSSTTEGSTTTIDPCGGGSCTYEVIDAGGGVHQWVQTSFDCEGLCGCEEGSLPDPEAFAIGATTTVGCASL